MEYSDGVPCWWSDCYGKGPRMFYHALATIPEWAPPEENHILYSAVILKDVSYKKNRVSYSFDNNGTAFLRISFKPSSVKLNGAVIKAGLENNPWMAAIITSFSEELQMVGFPLYIPTVAEIADRWAVSLTEKDK